MSLRFDVLYRLARSLTVAAAYENRVAMSLAGGHLVADLGALGLGRVCYSDVRIEGLALPREISLGAAWQASDATRVSLKASWLE